MSTRHFNPVPGIIPDQAMLQDCQDILMEAPIGFFISTPEGRLMWANKAMARMTGYGSVEKLTDSVADLAELICSDPVPGNEIKRQLENKGEILNQAIKITRLDGTFLWVSLNIRMVRDKDGGNICCQGFASDITHGKKAEESARLANDRLDAFKSISFLSAADHKKIADHSLACITSMTGSEYGFFGFMDESEATMSIHSWSGEAMKDCHMLDKPLHFPIDRAGVWSEAVRRRTPLILNDYCAAHPAKKGFPPGHVSLTNLLVVPIFSMDKITSVAAVANRPTHYGQDDVEQVKAFMVSIQAVIDRKQAEESLRKSEEQFRLLADNAPEAIFIQTQWRFAYLNKACLKLYGAKSQDELLGKPVLQRFHPDLHPVIRERIRLLNEKKRPVSQIEQKHITLQGVFISVEVSAVPFHFKGHDGALVFVHDITRRRQAENALRDAHQRLLTVLDSIKAFIFVTDIETHEVLFANKFMKNVLGDIEGMKCWKVMHPDQTGPCESCMNRHLLDDKGNPAGVYRWDYQNKATGKWYDCQDSAISWIDGRIVHLEISLDVTERKQAEEKINEINQRLEKTLAEKDMFFSIIAHDLKSPMSGLLSLSRLLDHDCNELPREEIGKYAQLMHKSADNLLSLMDNLLQWSRIQRGSIKYDPMLHDLNDLVTESVDMIRDVAGQKDIRLRVDIPEKMTVLADKYMVQTVIRNLVFNAVKFTYRGGNIIIAAHREEMMVMVSVEDDGMGMEQKICDGIFAIDKKTSLLGTEGEKGTGLGLILCREFVEKHEGEIRLESSPGQGTKVCFSLPSGPDAQETR